MKAEAGGVPVEWPHRIRGDRLIDADMEYTVGRRGGYGREVSRTAFKGPIYGRDGGGAR